MKQEDNTTIFQNADDAERWAMDVRNKMMGQFEEKSKFSIAEGMQDVAKKDFFTEFRNFDDVLRMNKIQMWGRLAKVVYGRKSRHDKPNIEEMLKIFSEAHVTDHKLNMTSLGRGREHAIENILRNDTGYVQQEKAVKNLVAVNTK